MAEAKSSMHIDAPQQQVWDAVTDLHNAADRIEGIAKMEVLTDGPVGKGTRFRETRIMFRKEATEEMEITEWDPPNAYTTECSSHGCHYTSVIRCVPDGNGTRVEMSLDAKPLTAGAKVMSTLLGWMMKGACAKAFAKDLEDIKQYVEGSPAPAGV